MRLALRNQRIRNIGGVSYGKSELLIRDSYLCSCFDESHKLLICSDSSGLSKLSRIFSLVAFYRDTILNQKYLLADSFQLISLILSNESL